MIGRVKKKLSTLRRGFRTRLFGNNHSVRTNLLYRRWHADCRRAWRPRGGSAGREAADAFRETGYLVLPPPPSMAPGDLAALRAKVDTLFAAPDAAVELGDGLKRMVEGLEKIPEIVDFIDPELEATLEAYFQSHFKIFGVYFYHTEPNPARPYSSFLWHADNCPSEEIKLMVYLDDVASDTGAMRLKTRSFSDDLKNRGFIGRDRYESFRAELDDPASTYAAEGPMGTRILFQNGSAIHKAVLPEREHRDVVTFVIIPSAVPWRVHYTRTRHLLSTNSGICMNPYTDEPQSIGYTE